MCILQDGKSRGHAVIEYDHPVEAVQAISMFNNQSLYDRKITVSLGKKSIEHLIMLHFSAKYNYEF